MYQIASQECSRIAQDLQIRKVQVESVVQLLDEGNSVPFIARYRKERTAGLREDVVRQIQNRVHFLRQLHDRKQTILKSIEAQGKLSEDLRRALHHADTNKRLDDLYLPFKPKKKSFAGPARDKGLEPLSLAIWNRDPAVGTLEELLPNLVNPEKQLNSVEEVRAGVLSILAEFIQETAEVRAAVRAFLWETGKITTSKSEKLAEGQGQEFKDYFAFQESLRQVPAHRILAINRAEKENAIKVAFDFNRDHALQAALRALAEHFAQPAPQPAPAPPAPEIPPQAGEGMPPPPNELPIEGVAPPLVTSLTPEVPVQPTETGELLVPEVAFRTPHGSILRQAVEEAMNRLLLPGLEREIRNELTDEAELHAANVFARNLRSLLMQPPLHPQKVLAIDPALRGATKICVLDEAGNLIEHASIYPFGKPERKPRERKPRPTPETAAPPQVEGTPNENPNPETSDSSESPPPVVSENPPTSPETPLGNHGESPPTVSENPEPSPTVSETSTAETSTTEPAPSEPAPSEVPPEASAAEPTPESASPGATGEIPGEVPGEAQPAPAAAQVTPVDRRAESKNQMRGLIDKHQIKVVALGNGPGCRELEEILGEIISGGVSDIAYAVVNESGTAAYASGAVGREEFPNLDNAVRAVISIGRRLQDPLSELVKVDAQHLNVGPAHHDVSRKELREILEAVVETCVNQVGGDLNKASIPLLRFISGLNQLLARELVKHRQEHGPFQTREQLLQVAALGPHRYEQAAGFLVIRGGANALDQTTIHPESYPIAEKILHQLGYTPGVLTDGGAREELHTRLKTVDPEAVARDLSVGVMTVQDILQALSHPGMDPRQELPPPVFKKGILKIDDLQPGMELRGTVLNVVDFGAFVDIGLRDSGLVHISEMANRYIKSPYDVVAVNDVVTVWVKSIDRDRHRVSLTMIKAGTERKPPERRPARDPGTRPPGPGGGRPPRSQTGGASQEQSGEPQSRPPQGRGGRGGPRHGGGRGRGPGGPHNRPQPADTQGGESSGNVQGGPAARPPLPLRKPRREPPKPQLTKAALEGKEPLRTFGELSALFAVKKPGEEDRVGDQKPRTEETKAAPSEAPPTGEISVPAATPPPEPEA